MNELVVWDTYVIYCDEWVGDVIQIKKSFCKSVELENLSFLLNQIYYKIH